MSSSDPDVPQSALSDVLVICTRDRAHDLRRCLAAVALCDPMPRQVIVVDSSPGRESALVVEEAPPALASRLRYVHADPGLTHQRNVGVNESDQDVVHFIDDDTEPDPAYFGVLRRVFEDDAAVVGAGGHIVNFTPPPPGGRMERLLYLDGSDGEVLPSGKNVHWRSVPARPASTQWLSGCSMSYRRSVLLREKFDEGLIGYALGEDVDLSVRAGQHGRLVHEPGARILHHESPRGRWAIARLVTSEVSHRHDRVLQRVGGQRPSAFWVSVAGQVLVSLVRGIVRVSRWELSVAWWTLRGGTQVGIRQRSSRKG